MVETSYDEAMKTVVSEVIKAIQAHDNPDYINALDRILSTLVYAREGEAKLILEARKVDGGTSA